jgi:hypothetical protein
MRSGSWYRDNVTRDKAKPLAGLQGESAKGWVENTAP